jgi:hypothetical protein
VLLQASERPSSTCVASLDSAAAPSPLAAIVGGTVGAAVALALLVLAYNGWLVWRGIPPREHTLEVLRSLGPDTFLALGIAVAATAGSAIARSSGEAIGAPYPARADGYDPEAADRFYGARLPLVVWRLATLTYLTGAFNVRLLLDYAQYKRAGSPEGEPWPNEKDRAKEALSIAVGLGPTFIKLAQALSIRTDLIPEAYALELRQLQDAVPPFDSALAKELLAQELNLPTGGLGAKFKKISAEPLAAASIGQVSASEQPSVRTLDGLCMASDWPWMPS